jgi:excisionase family DNA binding protein
MTTLTEKFLTTRELARLWLVSEATVKRWADSGLLPARRTAGGHRRFLLEEVTRFQSERGLGRALPPAAAAAGPSAKTARARPSARRVPPKQFFEAITRGEDDAAASLLLEAYLDGVPAWRLFDEAVAGAMRRVGDLWHRGTVTVADEHMATRTAVRAIERVGVSVRRREGTRRAVCCAAEGEQHDVAALCLQVVLESEGWRVANLGANTPFFSLAETVERQRPQLVCVTSTLLQDMERAARDYAQLAEAARSCGALLALGGEGFRPEPVRRRFPADLHGASFGELMEFIGRAG